MHISVVSDIHGNLDGLRRAVEQAEFLIVLGDLLQYIDYYAPEAGILGAIFGAEASADIATLRTSGRFEEMHAREQHLWNSLDDPARTLTDAIRAQYSAVLEVLGPRTLVTLGNVDSPSEWDSVAPAGLRHRDGEIVELDDLRIGFVAGGALKKPHAKGPWNYFERSHDQYRSVVLDLGQVDVLCTHVPPDIEELRYDIVTERSEMYGPGLVEAIDRHHPSLSVFGHVHHPYATEVVRGVTRCVNVGFIRWSGEPFVFDTSELHR